MNQISAYIDGELPEASVELVRLHLSSCLECAERFGYVEEQEEALARLLVNDPGDAFFAGFAERVLGPEAPPEEEKVLEPRPDAASSPPPRAAAPIEEPAPRTAPPKPPAPGPRTAPARPATPEPRPTPPRPPTAEPRAARPAHPGKGRLVVLASAVVLILSSVAIVTLRRGALDSPSASWIVEHLDPTSWFGGGAGKRGTRGADDRQPEPAPADSAPAIPTVVDSGALDRAAARSAMAESVRSPEAYDDAAAAWTDALPLLENDPEELASGRREVAAARYVAWSLMPTPNRRGAALDAVRAYLLVAPPGPERDLAWKWLARLKR
jgi:outer membrane biosynthesis protein TonB